VLSNSAISGAGIYNDGVMSLSNSQVILNTASLIGGGILNDTDAQLSLMSTQVRGNTATAGGGIYNTGGQVSVIEGSSINLNTASSGNGGGIENTSNGSMTIANASFEGNRAMGGDGSGRGGAIRHDSFQSFVITDSNFSGNEAVFGGALQVGNDTPLQVSGSTFDDNSASFNGGALHAVFLSVQNSSFEANHASVSGGAILAQAVAGISDSSFINNDALAGGAIQVLNLELTNVELRENGSSGGGAVSVSDAATIDRSRFIDNSGGLGGGLYVHDTGGTGNLTSITRSLFTGNTATDGGGVYIRSNASIGNTTIHNNFANNAGGLYIHADGDVTAVNMTLAGHITGQDLHKLGKLTMGNSIIFTPGQPDCLSTLDDPPIYSLGNNVTDDDSCFFDQDLPSDQEIANPMLDALADNGGGSMTLALLDGSALIDAGSNDLCAAAPVNGVDQRGAVRPQGATCDIGAHEQGSVAPSIDEIFKDGFEQN
jgi:predicted outer membrane repeat protein